MTILRLAGKAPFTLMFLLSCCAMLVGSIAGWRADAGTVGAVWGNLVVPYWAAAMSGAVLGTPFWLTMVIALVPCALLDRSLRALRRGGK